MTDSPKKDLYVVGYPKSGNTWLSRLLGDVLDSPVMARAPKNAIGDEGFGRDGDFVIRQEHLDYKSYKGENPVILVIRDPRDTAVSAWKYWQISSLVETIRKMHTGSWPITHGGGWANFYEFWMEKEFEYLVSYESLLEDTEYEVNRLLLWLDREPVNPVSEVVSRQSFDSRKEIADKHGDLMPHGRDVQYGSLRKGIAGDWQNHFDRECELLAQTYFGETASFFGYNLYVHSD